MPNQIQIAAISDTGNVRDNNEDNLYVKHQYMRQGEQGSFQHFDVETADAFVCAVCDGLGGEKSGEKASYEAVNGLHDTVSSILFAKMSLQEKIQEVNRFVGEINSTIYDLSISSFDYKGMGTTFACLVIDKDQAVAMHVGDSRVYLYRSGALYQLTRDHSESERLIRLGIITREQSRGHKSRFMLNRHLGMPPEEGVLEADVSDIIQLQKDDMFLLCSDGLTDMVEDDVISSTLSVSADASQVAQLLVKEALENGGKDNVTAILLRFDSVAALGMTSSAIINKEEKTCGKIFFLIAILILLLVAFIVLTTVFLGKLLNDNLHTSHEMSTTAGMNTVDSSTETITPISPTPEITVIPTLSSTLPETAFESTSTVSPTLKTTVSPKQSSTTPDTARESGHNRGQKN